MATSTRRAAVYVRVSTSDRGQSVENQLAPLQEAAGRLGWTVAAIFRDEGISGSQGRAKRPGLDALLKGVARRMLGVFSEFEGAMIRDRVMAGLDRARSSGKRLGRPRTTPFTVQRIRAALDQGRGVRETAWLLKVSAAKVSEVRRMPAAVGLHP